MHSDRENNPSSVNQKDAFDAIFGGRIKDTYTYFKTTGNLHDKKSSELNKPYSHIGKFRYRW